jgi:hypothetical protein
MPITPTAAGSLLKRLARDSRERLNRVLMHAGLEAQKADQLIKGETSLSLAEQLRLADAALLVAPAHRRESLRLRAQVLAARDYETGEFSKRDTVPPVVRWEQVGALRRWSDVYAGSLIPKCSHAPELLDAIEANDEKVRADDVEAEYSSAIANLGAS